MPEQPVRHVLLLKFSPQAGAGQIDEFIRRFRGLADQIEGILSFEHGENNSPEELNRGLTHVVCLTFASPQARDAYLPHPAHHRFGDWMGEQNVLDEILVIDYVPQG